MSAPTGGESWHGQPSAVAHSGTVPEEFVSRFGEGLARLVNGESTSAQLRRVEQERDEIKQAFAASQADLTHVEHQLREAEAERMKAERERAESVEWWRHELQLVEAELVSARAELEQWRNREGNTNG